MWFVHAGWCIWNTYNFEFSPAVQKKDLQTGIRDSVWADAEPIMYAQQRLCIYLFFLKEANLVFLIPATDISVIERDSYVIKWVKNVL